MQQQSRTLRAVAQAEKPESRHLPLVDLLIDTPGGVDRARRAVGPESVGGDARRGSDNRLWPRYAHQPAQRATRGGMVASAIVLGGRKVAIRRPRVRGASGELPLPTVAQRAATRRLLEQILLGVAT